MTEWTRNGNGAENDDLACLTSRELAQALRISERTLRRLLDAGKLLRPVRIGRSVRWRFDEVRRWIDAGCPGLREWERMAG